jgi:hypothetical protein
MKRILFWLRVIFPSRKHYAEIFKLIDKHNENTERAIRVIDNAILSIEKASLDGEDGWWCEFVEKKNKECATYVKHNHSTA